MKKYFWIFIIHCLFFHQYLYANYNGAFSEIFFGRQPSARSEAMGRGIDLLVFDGSSSFFNPANIARLKGTSLYTSYASPYYGLNKSSFTYFNLSTSLDKYGSVGFSRYDYNYGYKWTLTNENGQALGQYTTHQMLYTLSYAKSIMDDLFIGANINFAQISDVPSINIGGSGESETYNAYPIDIGIIKQFRLNLIDNFTQKIGIGLSLFNILGSSFDFDENNELPVLARFGISHSMGYNETQIIDGLETINWIIHLEYQNLLNDSKLKGYRAGSELSLFEIIFLRIGYYDEKINDYNSPDVNKNSLSEITYGFGIQIPFNKLGIINLPIDMRFDYAKLEQPSYTKNFSNWEDFTTWNININIDFSFIKEN